MARVRNWCLVGLASAALQCGSGANDTPLVGETGTPFRASTNKEVPRAEVPILPGSTRPSLAGAVTLLSGEGAGTDLRHEVLAGNNDTRVDTSDALVVTEQTHQALRGSFQSNERVLEFSSIPAAALAGDVALHLDSLSYDLHYDYTAGEVVTDGHGEGLDFDSLGMLLDAVHAVTEHLGPDAARWSLHEQMLYAAVSGWQQSGGMPLRRTTYALAPEPAAEVDKSIGDDGVICIQNGLTYLTSFDYGDTTVIDEPVRAGDSDCNGMCGPSCTQLQPWRMWTLDCMEHDQCCREIGDSTTCWTPLGECGDEYEVAEADFLRGFDPFARHCGG
jgi:hypothetical protein